MKQQNDWYTGIEYNHNEPETHIAVDRVRIEKATRSQFHEQVEIYYIFSGRAEMEINGSIYPVSEGSLILSVFPSLFYRFTKVEMPSGALCGSVFISAFLCL